MPLEFASPLEKGLDPKPFVTKTGSFCANMLFSIPELFHMQDEK